MNLDFDSLSDAEILAVIRRAHVMPRTSELHLQRYPVNPNRKDNRQRVSFRVWKGNSAIAHLIVGRGLNQVHLQTVAFHRDCPEISVRPLFFIQYAGVDYLGEECPGLHNLDEALSAGRIDVAGWKQAIQTVAERLQASARPSTSSQLRKEMVEFEATVSAIPSFTRIDAIFLRDTVFPLLRLEAAKLPPVTAWSNGDFIARNIVLDSAGGPRLVDYEFARRTHFAQADWFRLLRFSPLPAGVKPEDLGAPLPLPSWLEMRGWLEHAVKMDAVCKPAVAQVDMGKISERITQLVEQAAQTRYTSVFFDFAGAKSATRESSLAVANDTLAVEWSRQGSRQFRAEPPVVLQARDWNEIRVDLSGAPGRMPQLRLRLPATPCVLELRGMEVYGRNREQVLWSVDSAQMHTVVSCTGTVLDMPTSVGLGIVQFGGESFVTLPPLRLNQSVTAAGISVWVRYVPDLHDFSQRLRHAFSDGTLPELLPDGKDQAQLEGGETLAVTAQLFIPEGETYLEEKSIRTQIRELGAWIDLSFDLPPLPEGAVIRFDPADRPGLIEIASLMLEPTPVIPGPSNRTAARPWLADLRCEGDAIRLADEERVRILLFGNDPILKLAPLTGRLANRPCRLNVTLRFDANAPLSAWAAVLKEKDNAAIALNVRLHQLSIETGQRLADLDRQERQEHHRLAEALATAEAEVAKTRAELAAARLQEEKQRQALADETEAARRKGDDLQENLDLHVRERRQAEQSLLSSRAALAALEEENLRRQAELAQAQAGMKAEREAAAQLQQRLAQAGRDHQQGIIALAAAQAESEKLRSDIAHLQAVATSVRQGEARRNADLEAANRAIAGLKDELAKEVSARTEAQQVINQARIEREKLRTEAENVRAECIRHEQSLADSRQAAARQAAEAEQFGREMSAMLENAREQARLSEQKNALFVESLHAQNEKILDLTNQAGLLDEHCNHLGEELASALQAIAELKDSLAVAQTQRDRLKEDFAAATDTIARLENSLAKVSTERVGLAAGLTQARERIAQLEGTLAAVARRPLLRLDRKAASLINAAIAEPHASPTTPP